MTGLEIRDVVKTYDGFAALGGVSMTADGGKCTAVVGPNGAGKSTLFAVVSGQTKPDSGAVFIDDRDVIGVPPHKLASRGLSRTFQVARLFGTFTVRESVVMSCRMVSRSTRIFRDPLRGKDLRSKCDGALELVRLTELVDKRVTALTQGERKRLEFGMAMVQEPRVLVLDEPTAGMSRGDVEVVMDVLGEAKRSSEGLTILLSSHDMDVVHGLADRLVVMAQGTVLLAGEPREVANDQRVADVYLGRR
jgi:branched-chain amino acid transport system ATP-binding protein